MGFANTTVTANGTVKVIVAGTIDLSGLDAGDLYFLSPTTAGAITLTPPSGAGQAVTRVGEAATTTKLATHIRSSSSLSIMAGETNHRPYASNFEGVVGALLDFKDTSPADSAFKLFGVELTCFEDVTQGNALYIRASDGKVGKARADGTLDEATVFGVAETTKTAGELVRAIVVGQAAVSQTLDAGDIFFVSATTPGLLTKTPPSGSGQFVTRVGEAPNTTELTVQIKRPIRLG